LHNANYLTYPFPKRAKRILLDRPRRRPNPQPTLLQDVRVAERALLVSNELQS